MAAFIVARGTARRARSASRAWGALAGVLAALAFFTKAAAAFYVGALGLACAGESRCDRSPATAPATATRATALWTLAGLAVSFGVIARPLRAAALGRLPVLQLADVGHAQAVVRPAVADRDRVSRGFRSCTTRSAACGSCSCAGRRSARGASRCAGGARPTPSACWSLWVAVGTLELLRARRRQRAPVRLPDSRR